MDKHNIEMNLNKEEILKQVAKSISDCEIEYSMYLDISQAKDLQEAIFMGECIKDGIPDFEEEAKDKFKEFQKQLKKLSNLPFHEVLELGEQKGLWKLSEKQKRLI